MYFIISPSKVRSRAKAKDTNERNCGFTIKTIVLYYGIYLAKRNALDGKIFSKPKQDMLKMLQLD